MKKIIFVCLGNICRSPMAEMMMKHLIEEKNLSDQITVASRSTSTYEIGNSPHPGAIAELKIKNPNY
jgi:Protein-tyrosine-phosphatase